MASRYSAGAAPVALKLLAAAEDWAEGRVSGVRIRGPCGPHHSEAVFGAAILTGKTGGLAFGGNA